MKSRRKSSPAFGTVVFNPLNSVASTQHTDAQDQEEERMFIERYVELADVVLGKIARDTSKPKTSPSKIA